VIPRFAIELTRNTHIWQGRPGGKAVLAIFNPRFGMEGRNDMTELGIDRGDTAVAGKSALRVPKIGLLLVNLGSPATPTYGAVRRYLAQFLSDRRVIQLNPLLWQPILHLFILTFRPFRTAANYRKIWLEEEGRSPLVHFTQRQAELLGQAFGGHTSIHAVDWAMRYGKPTIQDRLSALKGQGCDYVLFAPMYPQYSETTIESVKDDVKASLRALPDPPQVRMLAPYYVCDAHIAALKASIERHVDGMARKPEVLVLSFHGIPKSYAEKGDPYPQHCAETTQKLTQVLDLPGVEVKMTFQSRFGPQEWLQPYTDETLEALGRRGTKSVLLVAPGFAADCIETLEELDMEGKEIFHAAGGAHYERVPCLNDSAESISMLKTLVEAEIERWAQDNWGSRRAFCCGRCRPHCGHEGDDRV